MEKKKTYLDWLHEITVLGYDQDIIIPVEHGDLIQYLFNQGKTAPEALRLYMQLDNI